MLNGQYCGYYCEVSDNRITNQVEQFDECWILSDYPKSYCDMDGFRLHGCLCGTTFSDLEQSGFFSFVRITREEYLVVRGIAISKMRCSDNVQNDK